MSYIIIINVLTIKIQNFKPRGTQMKYINNISTNPYYNLALEEYFLKSRLDDEFIILWQNEPSIIIGRNQNTLEEINAEYVRDNNINVVRRISGGGAVYHDLGNLNFSFVLKTAPDEFLDFQKFTLPVVRALENMGVKAELLGRNDITIDGKKISGNAQYVYGSRLLHHGTLLFDSDLDRLQSALNVKADKIVSKGIKSVRSRVTNIIDFLNERTDVLSFKSHIRDCFFEYHRDTEEYCLTEEDQNSIRSLMQNKYTSWDWNYGQSPPFNYKNSKRFKGGRVEVFLDIRDGLVNGCKVYGDFFGIEDPSRFEEAVKGLRYEKEHIKGFLSNLDVGKTFGGIGADELLLCFFDY
jgi:lipoate-protein ligase A